MIKRLKFAREHVDKPDLFWRNILWSDESKFNIFGSDGRRRVWRKNAMLGRLLLPLLFQ